MHHQGDAKLSAMRTVYRHMDALPWDLHDVIADVAQQDLDGRRRAVRFHTELVQEKTGGSIRVRVRVKAN
jgi:hypothetical protein